MKPRTIVLGIALLILFTGCNQSPSSVTRQYISAIQSNNIEKIKQYSTEETADLLAKSIESSKKAYGDSSVTVFREEIKEDKAIVTVQLPSGQNGYIDLVKINGIWKVSIK